MLRSTLLSLLTLTVVACGDAPINHHRMQAQATEKQANTSNGENVLHYESANLFVEWKWLKGPFGDPRKESDIMLFVTNSQGQPVNLESLGFEMKVKAWMPSMGHGTPANGDLRRIETGIYINSGILFTMGGHWDLHLDLYKNGQLADSNLISLHDL